MKFSTEELDFFDRLFSGEISVTDKSEEQDNLTVISSIPQNISNILGNAKLTLLAEISHYQLWFPFKIEITDFGEFRPILGIPEVIDNQLHERSWRVISPKNVTLYKEGTRQKIEILSLSNSGLTMRIDSKDKISRYLKNKMLEIHLPNHTSVKIALETVRAKKNVLAAKFTNIGKENEPLRKFLFQLHRSQNSELYSNIVNN